MSALESIHKDFLKLRNKKKEVAFKRFFKTGPGDYGEGDIFFGVTVPKTREVATKYFKEISLSETKKLLHSKIHEERMCALFILIKKFELNKKNNDFFGNKKIVELYLKNTGFVNNWDLVDLSAPKIIGEYFFENKKESNKLIELAKSELLWDRRIAIVSTLFFIKKEDFGLTLRISRILLNDEEDLIQKTVGWMLREVGKKNVLVEKEFLSKYYKKMPRVMLRYSIEKFSESERRKYLLGLI